ncbi:hypothetical protein B7494_g2458 [Chlorociboria aeruginascens]|nr:hypothetical protein B7494_g2458 [Chlorociboria aeruginascens]
MAETYAGRDHQVSAFGTTESRTLTILTIVYIILTTTIVSGRFISRWLRAVKFGADDWLMLAGQSVVSFLLTVSGGVGYHKEDLHESNIASLLQLLTVIQFPYGLTMAVVRFYGTIFLNVCWFIFVIVAAAALCTPFRYNWDKSIPNGKCGNQDGIYVAIAAWAIICDGVMWTLPFPVVWKLQLGLGQKLALSGVFALGIIDIVISILRIVELLRIDFEGDVSFTLIYTSIWSITEPSIAIVVGCAPILRPLLEKLIPVRLLRSRSGTKPSKPSASDKYGRLTEEHIELNNKNEENGLSGSTIATQLDTVTATSSNEDIVIHGARVIKGGFAMTFKMMIGNPLPRPLLILPTLATLSVLFIQITNSVASSPFNEQILAQGLLGAHFGRIGIPATYDYVVVGGGTAGLTIARRLAANNSYTVALIEAGGFYEFDAGNTSSIPADGVWYVGLEPIFRNPLIDWYQETTPQAGWAGRAVTYPSGKTFGGGSARNFMFYQRGSKGSYDKWACLANDSSYSFQNLLPYLQKSVNFTAPDTATRPANASVKYNQTAFSATGGPLHVSYPKYACAISSWIQQSLKGFGFKEVASFSDGNLLGYSYITATIDPVTATRSSSETSFLREAILETTNLNIYKSTLAQKVIFNNSIASGVQVNTAGSVYEITANKEVIISAGAFRSPQLLMTSGIGPKATLQEFGIPLISDLAGVGQNLWDHILTGPSFDVNVQTHSQLSTPAFAAAANAEYITLEANGTAFEKLPAGSISNSTRADLDATFGSDWPDVEYLFLDAYEGNSVDLIFAAPTDGKNYATSNVGLVAPFSRGNVTIASNDTAVNPIVNPNWFSDPRDQEVAIAGYKRARDFFTTKYMQGVVIGQEAFPGANLTTDSDILEVLKTSLSSIFHAAGTNKMGVASDPLAVVDSKARVFGVSGLRVVDASIFPILPPGHPQGTVYAIAEKNRG